jgi:hypothetical protein
MISSQLNQIVSLLDLTRGFCIFEQSPMSKSTRLHCKQLGRCSQTSTPLSCHPGSPNTKPRDIDERDDEREGGAVTVPGVRMSTWNCGKEHESISFPAH